MSTDHLRLEVSVPAAGGVTCLVSLEQNVLSMERLLSSDDLSFQGGGFMLGLMLPGNLRVLSTASAVSSAASGLIRYEC